MALRWFCRVGDQEVGPVTFQEMAQMVRDGKLTEGDRVRRETSSQWMAAREVIGLFRVAAGPPVAPAASPPEAPPQPKAVPRRPTAEPSPPWDRRRTLEMSAWIGGPVVIAIAMVIAWKSQPAKIPPFPQSRIAAAPVADPVARTVRPSGPDEDFKEMDHNHDGYVDLAEFLAKSALGERQRQTKIFELIDRDRDRKLALEEFKNQPPTVWFHQMDQSGDGFLDLVEFRRGEGTGLSRAHVGRLLKAIDRNNDGKLSFDEWLARPGEAWFVKMDENQDGRVSRHELAKGDSFLLNGDRVDRAFTTCDRNGDGFLTPDEFPDKPPETVFVYVDDNGDGKLSLAEFIKEKTTPEEVAAAKARFAKMDLDHDGFLRLREYLYHLADDAFWGMDRDGDGYVSREEYRQAAGQAGSGAKPDAAAKFAAMDLNRDGKLSFTEFKTAAGKEAQLASKDPSNLAPFDLFRQVDQNKDGLLDFKEFCLGEGRGRSPELAQKLFKLIDRNNDGKISLEELNTCPAEAWFMRIDRDQDGRISESELGRFDTFLLAGNRVGRAFANYDLNGDRFMSFEEFANRPPEVAFIYADNDGDGELSLAEFLGGRSDPKEVAEAKILFAKKDLDHDGSLSLREYLDDPADAAFWAMDQDRDGYVSREEYLRAAGRGADGTRPAASAKFGSMDLNHDGRLSLTEFRIAAKRK